MAHTGKRVGPRRQRTFQPALLGLALGVTLCIVAWGYLVKAAIDFGSAARDGESSAWALLALASLGAVACLFVGLMLVSRILRRLGITSRDSEQPTITSSGIPPLDTHARSSDAQTPPAHQTPPAPRVPGGRRAAR